MTILQRYSTLAMLLYVAIFTGCASRTPITPGTIPEAAPLAQADMQHGEKVLSTLSRQFQIEEDLAKNRRVRELVEKLAKAADAGGEPWRTYIFKSDTLINAAATRGNMIFIWTGMLNAVQDDDELATVLAHEIGHVLAKHTTPTASEQASAMVAGVAGTAAHAGLSSQIDQQGARLAGQLVGELVKAIIVNPESQRLELEADHIGLFIMAKAGYDPEKALAFWTRLNEQDGFGGLGLEFLSSHPGSEERIAQIKELLPKVKASANRSARYESFALDPVTPPSSNSSSNGPPKEGLRHVRSSKPLHRKHPAKLPPKSDQQEVWVVQEDWTAVHAAPSEKSKKSPTCLTAP